MKSCLRIVLMLALAAIPQMTTPRLSAAKEIDFGMYAAVAYSPSTGKYGYGWNHITRGLAERTALAHCTAEDARIVGWVKGGWLVLAVGEDKSHGVGWEYGDGAINGDAMNRAREQLKQRGAKLKTLVVLCSGDIDPRVYEFGEK